MMHPIRAQLSKTTLAVALFLGGSLTGAAFTGAALAGQPHMQSALRALNNAAAQLNAAAHDKAGHREKALALTNQAIGEVQAGIAAGQ